MRFNPQETTGSRVRLNYSVELAYELGGPAEFLLNVHAAQTECQSVSDEVFRVDPEVPVAVDADPVTHTRVAAFAASAPLVAVIYRATVDLVHRIVDPKDIVAESPAALPIGTLRYLYPSRYCQSDRLGRLAHQAFGSLWQGHDRVMAVQHWVQRQVTFTPNTTNGNTSAVDTLIEQVGVCRDFAHLMIALLRALNIPARIATGTDYGADPALGPPDFHAYVEVYLGGRWCIFDPSGTGIPMGFMRIGTGRDAADVAFATIFGGVRTQAPIISAVPSAGSPIPQHSAYAVSTDAGLVRA